MEGLDCLDLSPNRPRDSPPLSGNCSTTDETSDFVPGHFEGPEKTMEVVFHSDRGPVDGLRLLTREQLDFLCEKAKCTIVRATSNQYIDSYVLSESSLFVYRHRFIMKTCGTTTLLRCLSHLLEFTDAMGMELSYLGYSRKNLMFPDAQLWPHSSFGDEIRYLGSHEKLQNRLRGNGHILGPITGDHWFVYVADHCPLPAAPPAALGQGPAAVDGLEKPPAVASVSPRGPGFVRSVSSYSNLAGAAVASNERTINLMMFDMAPEVAAIFYQGQNGLSGREMTVKAGIHCLCPGATIDEVAFSPCGYSMNAILYDAYSTIHVTPEPQCSYVSFETNTCLDNYAPLVRNVLAVFRPRRFVLTMFGDNGSLRQLKSLPMDAAQIPVAGLGCYLRSSQSATLVDLELGCHMAVYALDPASLQAALAEAEKVGRAKEAASPATLSVGSDGNEADPVGLPLGSEKKERSYTWG